MMMGMKILKMKYDKYYVFKILPSKISMLISIFSRGWPKCVDVVAPVLVWRG